MKKRNVAVAMAAMTIAGTVAPVFAAQESKETVVRPNNFNELETKLKELLDTKYYKTDDTQIDVVTGVNTSTGEVEVSGKEEAKGKSVYVVAVKVNGTYKKLTSSNFKTVLTDALAGLKKGQKLDIKVTDRGHSVINDNIFAMGEKKYNVSTISSLVGDGSYTNIKNELGKLKFDLDSQGNIVVEVTSDTHRKLKNYLNDEKTEFNNVTGELKLVFTKPEDSVAVGQGVTKKTLEVKDEELVINIKPGETNELDFTKPVIKNNVLLGFENKVDSNLEREVYTIEASNSELSEVDVTSKLGEVTVKELAEELNDKYVFDTKTLNNAKSRIDEVNGKFRVSIYATAKKVQTRALVDNTMAEIVLESNTKDELTNLIDELTGNSKFESVVGANRIATSIEVSKNNYSSANNIVLVGEKAIVDGLAAAPLAAEKKAPILLTNKDELNKDVKDEIVRVLDIENGVSGANPKTVYIVGGTNVISESVEAELSRMGLNIKRLSGDNRTETSLEVAKEVQGTSTNINKLFVVGRDGEADAMSIAPVAAQLNGKDATPILVVDDNSLTNKEFKNFVKSSKEIDIIGGETVVSEGIEKQLKDEVSAIIERVKGDNRRDTNAEVISKYFNDNDVKNIYVAKDGQNKKDELVDALSVAPVAGSKKAPIILSTNEFTTKQAIQVNNKKSTNFDKLVQVGGGIAESVIAQIKNVLGL